MENRDVKRTYYRTTWSGLVCGFLVLSLRGLHAGAPRVHAAAPPEVIGEIAELAASPDGERLAFVVNREEQPAVLGLYDLKAGKLLTQVAIKDEFVDPELTWAPDSSTVCLRTPGDEPFALSREGTRQALAIPDVANGILWRDPPAATLVYSARHGEAEGLFELDVRSGKKRLLRTVERLGLGLHRVGPHPCYVELEKRERRGRRVRARRIDDGGTVFRLWLPRQKGPVPDPDQWDGPALSVSPDGRYFFVAGQVSANTFDLLGRVEEAGTLFRKPHHAAVYHVGLLSGHTVQWVPASGKTKWALLNDAGSGRLKGVVDPETGARYEDRFPGVSHLEFLPDGDQVGVDASGIQLNQVSTFSWNPERLLVRVRHPGR